MTNEITYETYLSCTLCPRMCRVDREKRTGYCGCGDQLYAARASLHYWEEPCISGSPENTSSGAAPGGSGTVFFSGCTLRCIFCQNHTISHENFGQAISARQLSRIFLHLQEQGAYNINLVTPTQYLPHIIEALDLARPSLTIPVVYNCGGYERVETVRTLADLVDIWLPDFKYYDSDLARRCCGAPDYFPAASAAIAQMIRQTGSLVWEDVPGLSSPLLKKGVIIRHMVLPSHRQDSIRILQWISDNLPKDRFLISLLSQYTPLFHSKEHPDLNRRITSFEYNRVVEEALKLGLNQGFMQEKSSARQEYTPPFNLEGLNP